MKQRGLVFLDVLLDTRHSTVKCFGDQVAETLADSPTYRARHTDNFSELTNGAVDDAEYRRLYAARDIDTILNSQMTDFMYHLRQDMKEGWMDMMRGVTIDELGIDVNIWPYTLDAQSVETIRRCVAYYQPPDVKVRAVRFEPERLTPKFLENHYEMMAIYDHEDWLGPNYDAVLANPLPNFVVMTPMIASSGQIPDLTDDMRDPFRLRSAALQFHFALHWLSVDKVCYNPTIRRQIQNQRSLGGSSERPSHQEQTSLEYQGSAQEAHLPRGGQ